MRMVSAAQVWKRMAEYSPFAFPDGPMEAMYHSYRAWCMSRDIPLSLLMTVLFWSVSLLRGAANPAPPLPYAFQLAGAALTITSAALFVYLLWPITYGKNWAGIHLGVHLTHIPIFTVARTILLELYTPYGGAPCWNALTCAHEHLLMFPHVGTGILGAVGIPLPLLVQALFQLIVLGASIPGNHFLCKEDHVLTPLVTGLPDPLAVFFPSAPAIGGAGGAKGPITVPCAARLGFWEIQISTLVVGVTLVQDALSRRHVVATVQSNTPGWEGGPGSPLNAVVQTAGTRNLRGPSGSDYVAVAVGLLVVDGALVGLLTVGTVLQYI